MDYKRLKKIKGLMFFLTVIYLNGYSQTATAPSGSGSSTDPYLISSLENLYWVSTSLINNPAFSDGKFFLQTNDIDASSTSSWTNKWIPIGGRNSIQPSNTSDDENREFRGAYNGAGYIIDGVTYNNTFSGNDLNGFFGSVKGRIINLRLTNLSITTNSPKTGGLVAMLKNQGGLIYNCSTSGTIASTSVSSGGLVGQSQGLIFNSYSTCAVSASSVAGVLLGLNQGNIYDCYSQGSVTTTANGAHIGGLIAEFSTNPLFRSYANTSITIAENSTTTYDGGLIGRIRTNMSTTSGSENYWNTDVYTIGRGTANTNSFFGSGLSSEELKDSSNFGANWDFVNTWGFGSDGYPTLINTPNTWLGINTNWDNTSNWSLGVVPNTNNIIGPNNLTPFLAKDMVYIPVGLTNYPILTGNVTAYSIHIDNGTSIDLNGFSITSSFYFEQGTSNTSTWTGANNSLWNDLSNWNPQIIPQNTNDIVIPNTTNKPIISSYFELVNLTIHTDASLTMQPLASLKVNGNITNNGQIIFKSDATGDSHFDEFTGSISGTGDVVVEKYYPARHAFRMVASPVNSTTSIYDNWQNGGNNVTGIGTHITGSATGANGFDQTETGNPSMFEFITGTGWQAIANTNATNLTAGTPYRLMVRGDRNVDLSENNATPNPTTLISTGTLEVGTKDFTFPSATGGSTTFAFVANPYQSRIDVSNVLTANGNANNNQLWVWDPMINTRGAFVTIDELSGNGTATPTSSATKFIEPGQAFFIELTGSDSEISFTESVKDVTTTLPKSAPFSDNQMSLLFELQNEGNQVIDAIRLRFAADGITEVDAADISKMGNIDENLASVNENSLFTIQRRSFPENDEVIPLFTNNWRNENYSFKANLANFEDTNVYLVDNYLGTETLLENGEVYNFSVDAGISDSTNPLRFELKFDTISLSIEELDNHLFSLYPNPAKDVVNIQTSLALGSQVSIEIYNMLGQQVHAEKQTLKASSLVVNVQDFSSGVYILSLTDDAGNKQSTQLIKE